MTPRYLILISHIVVLFPLSICIWKYKNKKDYKALYVAFQLMYTACFSVVYHTYDCKEITNHWDPQRRQLKTWRFLDWLCSKTLIFTNIAYIMRFKTEFFYLLSHSYMILFLILEFFSPTNVNTFINILLCVLIVIVKFKTFYKYILNFWKHTLFAISILIAAIYCLMNGNDDYITFHSMWHLLVFGASGTGCLLKDRLDKIIPIRQGIYREKSDSL